MNKQILGAALAGMFGGVVAMGIESRLPRAHADLPAGTPEFYSGILFNAGQPVADSMHTVDFQLFDLAANGSSECDSGAQTVTAGHFQLAIGGSCASALSTASSSGGLFVQLTVDSVAIPPAGTARPQVGVVPYASQAASVPFAGVTNVPVFALESEITSLQSQVTGLATGRFVATINGKPYSVGATKFAFATSTGGPNSNGTYDGAQVGGYNGAKAICAAAGSASAHMCTGDEIVRSMAVGIPVGSGWISLANVATREVSGTEDNILDCNGWTVNVAATLGTTFNVNNPSDSFCNQPNPILCCD